MSYFIDNLINSSKPKKNSPSSVELRKLLPQVKPQKWLMYKATARNIYLFSLESHTLVLEFRDTTVPTAYIETSNYIPIVYDIEVFNKIAESFIGKGNNYLYFEYGKPMESRKVPFHKKQNVDIQQNVIKGGNN